MKKMWIVVLTRCSRNRVDRFSSYILGLFDSFDRALARVNGEFCDQEDMYIDEFGGKKSIEALNHNNGYAEITVRDIDKTPLVVVKIEATDIPVNKDTCFSI